MVASLGADDHPVGRDEYAVQADEGPPAAMGPGQHVGRVGSVPGEHVECSVQVAVGGDHAEAGLAGAGAQVQAVAQPAQHKHDWGVHRAGAVRRPRSRLAARRAIHPVTAFNKGADTSRLAR